MKNFNDYVSAGDNEYSDEHFGEAADLYEKAYEMQDDFEISKKLVSALINDNQAEKAELVVESDLNSYLNDIDGLKILTRVFLENDDFLRANQLVVLLEDNKGYSISNEFIEDYKKQLEKSEQRFLATNSNEVKEIEKELTAIVIQPTNVQIQQIQMMNKLPLANYLKAANMLLLNPYLQPLFKTEIIENIVKLAVEDSTSMIYWDQKKNFIPKNTPLVMNSMEFLQSRSVLNYLVGNDNPDYQTDQLHSQFTLYIAMLYPFQSEKMTNVEKWVEVLLQNLNVKNFELDDENKEIKDIQDTYKKIDELLESFGQN